MCLRVCVCLPVCAHAGHARRRSERRRCPPAGLRRVWAPRGTGRGAPPGPRRFLLAGWVCASGSASDPSFARHTFGTAVLFPSFGLLCGPRPACPGVSAVLREVTREDGPPGALGLLLFQGWGVLEVPPLSPSFPGLARILAFGSSGWWRRGWAVVPCRGPEPVSPGPCPGGTPDWLGSVGLPGARLSAGGGARSAPVGS